MSSTVERHRRSESTLASSQSGVSARTSAAWGLTHRGAVFGGLAVCLGLLLLPLSVAAETWTNQAGQVVIARLVALAGEQAILQSTNGRMWRLPLSSLKPADQQRAREQTGTERLPSELRTCLIQAQEDFQRAAQFLQGGKITREQYAARCEQVLERFDRFALQILKERGEQLDRVIVDRLRQRLARELDSVDTTLRPLSNPPVPGSPPAKSGGVDRLKAAARRS